MTSAPQPEPTMEERVLALQEAGRPFSAMLDLARAVDDLDRRLDRLEGEVSVRPPADPIRHIPDGPQDA